MLPSPLYACGYRYQVAHQDNRPYMTPPLYRFQAKITPARAPGCDIGRLGRLWAPKAVRGSHVASRQPAAPGCLHPETRSVSWWNAFHNRFREVPGARSPYRPASLLAAGDYNAPYERPTARSLPPHPVH